MKTILVIDDSNEIRENTAEILELNNYRVLIAEDGHSGLTVAKTDKPDLILCDLVMPGTDGREFLKIAKQDESLKHIPIVLFSAGSAGEIEKELKNKANGIIKKPFTEQELLSGIRSCFEVVARPL